MFLGRICEVRSFRDWVVSVQREEEDALGVEMGSFVKLEGGLVGCVVGAEQKVPEEYVGRDIEDDDVSGSLFPGNIVDRSRYEVLGLGDENGFVVDRQPRLRESVELMGEEEVRGFHKPDGDFSVSYVGDLMDYGLVGPEPVVAILRKVQEAFPGREGMMESLKSHARRVVDE